MWVRVGVWVWVGVCTLYTNIRQMGLLILIALMDEKNEGMKHITHTICGF